MGCLQNLKVFNLDGNQLASLEGLNAPSLQKLDLSNNQLEKLEFIGGAPKCSELILAGCKLSGDDIQLPELKRLAADTLELQSIALSGNPLFDVLGAGENPKAELLARIPQVTRMVGAEVEDVNDEERQAALTRVEELIVLKKEADEAAE